MKRATHYQKEGSIGQPANQVFAIFDHEDDAIRAIEELNRKGFSQESIGYLQGKEDAHKMSSVSGEEGAMEQAAMSGVEMGDKDSGFIKKYHQALVDDARVLSVSETKGSSRREIAALLARHGGRFINSYGLFVIETLEGAEPRPKHEQR